MIAYLRSGLERTLCLSFLTFASTSSMAQDTEDPSSDVPSIATSVNIMKPRKIDWETGIILEWDRRSDGRARTFIISTSLFRLELTPQAEVRPQIDECVTHIPEGNLGGITNTTIGTKTKAYEDEEVIPKISPMSTVLVPGGSGIHYLSKHISVQARLLFENGLSSRFTLGYGLGGEWNRDTESPDPLFGTNPTYQPTDKWSSFVEDYNRYNSKRQDDWTKPRHDSHFSFMDGVGVDYKVLPRLYLNTYYSISFNEFSRYSSIRLGTT